MTVRCQICKTLRLPIVSHHPTRAETMRFVRGHVLAEHPGSCDEKYLTPETPIAFVVLTGLSVGIPEDVAAFEAASKWEDEEGFH